MKLWQIVDAAKFYLGIGVEKPGADRDDETTRKLAACANIALAEIAAEYAPLTDRATVRATDGRFLLSALPRKAVAIRSVTKDGREVAFVCRVRDCEVADNGLLTVEYVFAPKDADFDDECDVIPSVSAKTVALGALAEYCAIEGMPDLAEDFGERFGQDMRAATRKRREIRLPQRSWK